MELCIRLHPKRVNALIFGGGLQAARRADGLLEGGARAAAVSGSFCTELEQLLVLHPNTLRLVKQTDPPAADSPLWEEVNLVVAAEADPDKNAAVLAIANAKNLLTLCVQADQPALASVMSSRDEMGLILAGSTGGASPSLTAAMMDDLAGHANAVWAPKLAPMATLRSFLLEHCDEPMKRRELLYQLARMDAAALKGLVELIRILPPEAVLRAVQAATGYGYTFE
ncbi:MAG: hypothetical protein IJ484_02200 [Oscillospiraceae bacterium]|nr:hypothetical protein [Oscillospiraceae bacterium]